MASSSEIMDRVWLANWQDATDPGFLRRHRIGLIINTTSHIQSPFSDSVATYRIPVIRYQDSDALLLHHIPIVARHIRRALQTTHMSVLIHCVDGTCRGPTVVAGFLILELGMSKRDAIALVRQRKPNAFQRKHLVFENVLDELEKMRHQSARG
jgi:protein-tyrosine phosphatase